MSLFLLLAGAVVVLLVVVVPIARWRSRSWGAASVRHLVPDELAAAHVDAVAAAALPGVVDPASSVAAADLAVIETAAILGGRPPRGGAQRRFVAARVSALTDLTTDLRERHEAWTAARAELDALVPPIEPSPPARPRPGVVVFVGMVVLLPFMLAWDAVLATGHGLLALADGVVLRVRLVGRAVVGLVTSSVDLWRELRASAIAAAREASGRAAAARVRLRMRLRLNRGR